MAIKTEVCENCEQPVERQKVSRVDTVDGVMYVCDECVPEFRADTEEDECPRNDE